MRGTPANQADHAALRMFRPGLLSLAHGMTIAAFDQQSHGFLHLVGRFVFRPLPTKYGDRIGQAQDVSPPQQKQVSGCKQTDRERDEKIQRQLDPPGKPHQQHVALVVASGHGEPNGESCQRQQPEYGAHDQTFTTFFHAAA
jgi:hypothetical protein